MHDDSFSNYVPRPKAMFDLDRVRPGTEEQMTLALFSEYSRILASTRAAIAYWRARNPNDPFIDSESKFTISRSSHPAEIAMWVEAAADEAVMGIPGVNSKIGSKYSIGMRQAFLKRFYEIDASPDDPSINRLIREAAARRDEYTTTLRLALDNHITLDEAHNLYLALRNATQGIEDTDAPGHTIYIGRDDAPVLKQTWDALGMPQYRPDLDPGDDFSNN
jgi:hypothetical protein